ncbi:MAG TPA: PQQ-dependent sugar dehydrogenase [Steroidobacteraceae bacterium]|nr:PQQ-dependent sugar dehydrogenase [Steroidobacteraceae bacterium]
MRSAVGVRTRVLASSLAVAALLLSAVPVDAEDAHSAAAKPDGCPAGNAGLKLPPGFCATVFADKIGHARHLVVAPNGAVYVNTWSGRYYGNDKLREEGFLVVLRDTKGTGRADVNIRFGDTAQMGSAGGTGIALYNGALYAEMNDRIVRYALSKDSPAPAGKPEVVVSGLPLTGDHPMHPFVIDPQGAMYVDVASATNSCQKENRTADTPGMQPCTELETRGGIWRYDANKTGQVFSPAERYATGIRNADGLALDPGSNTLYSTQHGRDQLGDNWSRFYTPQQGAELPAEELLKIRQGGDYGWPECYFDNKQDKLVLAPEYGGDGGKKVGVCAGKLAPVAAYPAHWAPNDVTIYSGTQFPQVYRGGAFIAFHGSWNRAPFPQGGYNLVFQPLANGKASARYVIFADGFAGAQKEPGKAAHRPSGLAVGPDGALYVSDDQNGRIWRITYTGSDPAAKLATVAPVSPPVGSAAAVAAKPPEGLHKDAGAAALAVPPGSTAKAVALGRDIFAGRVGEAPCTGCHGSDGRGTPLGPDLTAGKWTWSDGSLAGLRKTITQGVPQPKNYRGAMPPMGGAQLSDAQASAVAAYVWSLGHPQ